MNVSRCFLRFVIALIVITIPIATRADTLTFQISGGDTGTITINETAGLISSVSGTFDGSSIAGILGVGTFGGNDNLYTGSSPFVDGGGLSFSLTSPDSFGYTDINLSDSADPPSILFGSCQANTLSSCNGVTGFGPAIGDSIALAATPEPSSLVLSLLGLGAFVGSRRR